VALVAIGPKDLPKAMHMIGVWVGKARGMVHDLQRSFDQLQYEAEIAEKLKTEPPKPAPEAAAATTETERDRPGSA
jgi:sec-independent protein translocase protein TatB